jgi:LEA14-like dessication related protein
MQFEAILNKYNGMVFDYPQITNIDKLMRTYKTLFITSISFLLFFTSCDVMKQVSQISNLTKCEFRLESVQQLNLAGINVQNVKKISDLNMFDAAKIASALSSQQFPLDFTLNIEAKNPNSSAAGMTRIDWILLIDDIEMTRGIQDKQVTIPANNGIAVIPMQMHVDLQKALTGKSADAVINFAMNLAGSGNKPTRFTLQMKPAITVGGFPITYPGYLNVKTEFGIN